MRTVSSLIAGRAASGCIGYIACCSVAVAPCAAVAAVALGVSPTTLLGALSRISL